MDALSKKWPVFVFGKVNRWSYKGSRALIVLTRRLKLFTPISVLSMNIITNSADAKSQEDTSTHARYDFLWRRIQVPVLVLGFKLIYWPNLYLLQHLQIRYDKYKQLLWLMYAQLEPSYVNQ
jgi:hypothetical protein